MITENLENINNNNIILCEPVKNSVLSYNYFYKLLYSNHFITFNGIFNKFSINEYQLEDNKILFKDSQENKKVFNLLIELEKNILNLLPTNKTKVFKLKEIYNNQVFKFNHSDQPLKNIKNLKEIEKNNNQIFILKISGIWESRDTIGLTFKIITINKFYNFE